MNDWLDAEQAAAHIGMSVPFVRRLYRSGAIEAYKPGGKVRVRRGELDAWLEGQKITPAVRPKLTLAPRKLPAEGGLRTLMASTRDPASEGEAA